MSQMSPIINRQVEPHFPLDDIWRQMLNVCEPSGLPQKRVSLLRWWRIGVHGLWMDRGAALGSLPMSIKPDIR